MKIGDKYYYKYNCAKCGVPVSSIEILAIGDECSLPVGILTRCMCKHHLEPEITYLTGLFLQDFIKDGPYRLV